MATALRAKAIARVRVQVDTSYAPGPQVAAGWQPAFRALGIVGPVAMLGLSTQWAQSGKPGPADPVAEVVAAFAARLSDRGIPAVAGGRASGAGVSLGEVRSAPVTDVLGLALEPVSYTHLDVYKRQGRPPHVRSAPVQRHDLHQDR